MYQIDISQTQDMGVEGIFHAVGRHATLSDMVCIVTISMLHVLYTAWALEGTCGSRVIVLVEIELQDIEALLAVTQVVIAPEVVVHITGTHHCRLTAHISIKTLRGILCHIIAKGILKVGRGTTPASPTVTELIEALGHQVALLCVLASPLGTNRPAPGNQTLIREVVRAAEDVFEVLHQRTAGIVDHVQRGCRGTLQIVVVQTTRHTGCGEQHLGIQALSAVEVDTAFCALGPRQQFHCLFQCHQDVFIDICLLNLRQRVVVAC